MIILCAKPGRILSSPKMKRIIYSSSTLSVETRKRNKYLLKCAIRRSVDDMDEILRSANQEMAEFLRDEIRRLQDVPRVRKAAAARGKAGMDLEDELW